MIITEECLKKVIRPRQAHSHKGDYGHVLLIGGCYPYHGAIIMAALACVHSGAGLVTVATERTAISSLHSHLPEAMAFDLLDKSLLAECLAKADVILLGPGLGTSPMAREVIGQVLEKVETSQTLILDGSALTLLSQEKRCLPTCQLVLTPHQMEWQRLSGVEMSRQDDTSNQAALAAFPPQTILVAKSHQTTIYQEGSCPQHLTIGGPYQAIGGMGDTLAGMIAGFVAQFRQSVSHLDSVVAATYLHSAIAKDLSQTYYVTLPTDRKSVV